MPSAQQWFDVSDCSSINRVSLSSLILQASLLLLSSTVTVVAAAVMALPTNAGNYSQGFDASQVSFQFTTVSDCKNLCKLGKFSLAGVSEGLDSSNLIQFENQGLASCNYATTHLHEFSCIFISIYFSLVYGVRDQSTYLFITYKLLFILVLSKKRTWSQR